jgi:glutamate---cysteine ligase / carboxylate-amine ligase
MSARFTLGIEEEFQIVDRRTGQLVPRIATVLTKGTPFFGEQLKAEMLQSCVELASEIFPDIVAARSGVQKSRGMLARLMAEEGLALISAGTHPTAVWTDQRRSDHERYLELEEEYQDVARSILIFGLHIHVGMANQDQAVRLTGQLRNWLPHILALSTNSPFWGGRLTGLKSYRAVVWKRFPRSGTPDVFASGADFDTYVQALINAGCIDNAKKIWWDIRPHPFCGTIEFRVADMPATVDDTLALAALCQALVAKLTWLDEHAMTMQRLPRYFLEENKWRAMRYGLEAEVMDFKYDRCLPMRAAIAALLEFVDDVLDDLGSRQEINYLRGLLDDPRGTGADRQIAVYKATQNAQEVVEFLMRETMQGIP